MDPPMAPAMMLLLTKRINKVVSSHAKNAKYG